MTHQFSFYIKNHKKKKKKKKKRKNKTLYNLDNKFAVEMY